MEKHTVEIYGRLKINDPKAKDIIEAVVPENQIIDTFIRTLRECVAEEAKKRGDAKKFYQSKQVTFDVGDVEKIGLYIITTTLKRCSSAVEVRLRNK